MRQVDEILGSYPTQSPAARRYLLRRLERLPITLDAAGPLGLLTATEEDEVADFGRLAEDAYWGRYEEERIRRAGGDASQEAGEWTRFMGTADAPRSEDLGDQYERAAAYHLANLVAPVAKQVGEGGGRARLGLKVLSRIRTPASLDAIHMAAAAGPVAPMALAALSHFGGDAAGDRALKLLKGKAGTPVLGAMLPALRGLPSKEAFALLGATLEATPKLAGPVAAALEGFAAYDYQPLLDKVIASGDPWAAVQAIETMGRIGGKAITGRLGGLFERVENPLARIVCLQALSETGATEAGAVAIRALGTQNPVVQAAAVEALVRLPVPTAEYAEKIYALLETPHPKLAMNVSLACVHLDPGRAVKRIREILASGSPGLLLQGIQCLAYLDFPASAAILGQVVKKAPAGPLRLQAIRALGRRAADDPQHAAPALFGFLGHDDSAVRQASAWFAAGCHPAARKAAVARLAAQLQGESDGPTAAVLAEALGLAGPDALEAAPTLEHRLGAPEPAVAAAAAWTLAALGGPPSETPGFNRHPAAAVRARALLGRWLSRGEGLDDLVPMLSSRDESEFLAAGAVAREVAESAVYVGEAKRAQGLAARLSNVLESSGFALRREALDPAFARLKESMVMMPGQAQLPELFASGRKPERRKAQGGDKLRLKLAVQKGIGNAMLPDEAEAARALMAARRSAPAEVDRAVQQASYYGEGSSTGPQGAAGGLRWWLAVFVYLAGAVALGRILRAWWSGGL